MEKKTLFFVFIIFFLNWWRICKKFYWNFPPFYFYYQQMRIWYWILREAIVEKENLCNFVGKLPFGRRFDIDRSKTAIWSAFLIVLSLCAIVNTVLPRDARSRASCTKCSLSASKALVASSSIKIRGFYKKNNNKNYYYFY